MEWFRRRRERSRPHSGTAWSAPGNPEPDGQDRWDIGWGRPDLTHADAHALEHYRSWERYVPHLELVPCGDRVKPALFFVIGYAEYDDWATVVQPVTMGWNWYRTKGASPYVVIDFHVAFANGNGTPIGVGGAGQTTLMTTDVGRYAHQLRTRTLLDPGDRDHRAAIEAWAAGPAPTMLFFVEENFRATAYVSMEFGPETKSDLLRVLTEAGNELAGDGIVPGAFPQACELVAGSLPAVSWWKD